MLKWAKENGKHFAFEDGTLRYIVDCDKKEGWRWIDVFDGWSIYGYLNAESAKAGAENDYANYPKDLTEDDKPFLVPEEINKILDDMLHEES